MIPRRLLPALIFAAILILAIGACGPLGGDDDDDDNPAPSQPTATREVVISTFTATEVVAPADKTATQEAQQADLDASATARANLPTPTSAATITDVLYPPQTRLQTPNQLTESYLSTYSWQFNDEVKTYSAIEAPITVLEQGPPVEVNNGDQLAIIYYGSEYRTPPLQLEVAIYDFETNSAIPVSQTGQSDQLAFAIKTEPLQNLRVDQANPTFVIDGFPPGHYIIWAQGRWGQHPVIDRPLFVTWVFDIEIVE